MSFVASKVFWMIVAPSTLMLTVLVAGVLLFALGRRRFGGWLVGLATAALAATALLPVGTWVLAPLEDRFARPDPLPAHVDGIIVLGGATEPDLAAARNVPALNDAAERMIEFAALARRYPAAKLVFTGGSGDLLRQDLREAEVARMVFDGLGLETGTVLLEGSSRNTFENAVFSRDLAQPRPGETWLLVTSARHMPRSVGIFRHLGWPVVAYPTDYLTRPAVTLGLPPGLVEGLIQLNHGVREWIGLVAYRLMDRTDSLFPAPR